jgi:hypothetical protein
MRVSTILLAAIAALALNACSSNPHPLAPDSLEGPTSYICFNSWSLSEKEVRDLASKQCQRSGMQVKRMMGTVFSPLRCGFGTPEVAAFSCGGHSSGSFMDYSPRY